jgi:arylsulfatase A-like enzyme
MKRRDFLKTSAALTGSSLMSGLGLTKLSAQSTSSNESPGGKKPNILFILVDELRYPSVFPKGIKDAGKFFKAFMPNVYNLWKRGVKFDNYHTAANACTPSRGSIITGLYSQQSWLMTTIVAPPNPSAIQLLQPVLNPAYPTYGKLLRKLGYETPYRGKWHVSIPQKDEGGLEAYGFDYTTYPDGAGANLQGTYGDEKRGFHNDAYTAEQAVDYLGKVKPEDKPFCLTVSFINPHDREFFPMGTEFQTFTDLFATGNPANPTNLAQGAEYPGKGPVVKYEDDALKAPRDYGYPELPPNWENAADWAAQDKPSTQTFVKVFSELFWGGISEDRDQKDFTIVEYPSTQLSPPEGVAMSPFSYWRRGLDSYTQIMQVVDLQIGRVLEALRDLPKDVIDNTVIVFTSDHGEYSGAHGLPQGKLATIYEEAWHIPLIVVDPTERFTGDIDDIRHGLTSSVDLMSMLVSLGDFGTTNWMKGDLKKIYGQRHDMISMLKSSRAPGRSYVLHATDEIAPNIYNYLNAPTHVLALRTDEYKFGISADWRIASSDIIRSSGQLEFYDYNTERGRMELENNKTDPRARHTLNLLLNDIIPNELQQLLPPSLRLQQLKSKAAHLAYRSIVEHIDSFTLKANGGIEGLLGLGGVF